MVGGRKPEWFVNSRFYLVLFREKFSRFWFRRKNNQCYNVKKTKILISSYQWIWLKVSYLLQVKIKMRPIHFSTLMRNAARARMVGSKSIMFIVTFELLFNTLSKRRHISKVSCMVCKAMEITMTIPLTKTAHYLTITQVLQVLIPHKSRLFSALLQSEF